MIKQLSFLCVVWMAPLALGQESQVSPSKPETANDSKTTTPEVSGAPYTIPSVPLSEAYSTPAAEKSDTFSQLPPGFSMKFDLSGSFNLSFDISVDKDKAKEKMRKAKTKKATNKAKSETKTKRTR